MTNYEDEIFDGIINGLSYMYGILDNEVLYRYTYLRFLCSQVKNGNTPKIDEFEKNRLFINFIIEELNLEETNGGVLYKGIMISKSIQNSNSFTNIIEDWEFRSGLYPIKDSEGNKNTLDNYIKKSFSLMLTNARNKSKKYKKDKFYEYYIRHFLLKTLNDMFGIKNITPPKKFDGFRYSEFHNSIKLLLEEECYRYIHFSRFESNNVGAISEEQLEDFLIKNLDLIEEGLTYVNRQVIIANGRLDILAKDKSGCYVILELKVCEDKEIVWQSAYYPSQFKLENGIEIVRFITVLPESKEHIITPLKALGYVEVIEYKPYIQNGRLVGIKIRRL